VGPVDPAEVVRKEAIALGANDIGPARGGAESFFLPSPRTLHAVEAGDLQRIERIGDGLQMLGREMQVDKGVLQPGMSE
jgi:hypothetical protein